MLAAVHRADTFATCSSTASSDISFPSISSMPATQCSIQKWYKSVLLTELVLSNPEPIEPDPH